MRVSGAFLISNQQRMIQEDLYKPGCVRTYSGVYFNLKKPQHTDVYVMDIAVALARECRFINATKNVYSVAEHSVMCALIAEEKYPNRQRLPFEALMHDAHEYIWRDMATPIKDLLPGYRDLQQRTQMAINQRYNIYISIENKKLIDEIDKEVLEWEWENKMLRHTGLIMPEADARAYFLHHFKRLCHVPYALTP